MTLSWKSILYLYICLYTFVSTVFFLVGVSGFSATPYIRAAYILPLLILTIFYVLKIGGIPKVEGAYARVVKVFVLFIPIWLGIGVSNGGLYLITDFLYGLLFILIFFVFYGSLRLNEVTQSEFSSVLNKLVLITIGILDFNFIFGMSPPGLLLVFVSVYIVYRLSMFSDNKYMKLYLLFSVLMLATTGNRGYILSLVVVLVCIVFFVVDRRKMKIIVPTVIIIPIVIWSLFSAYLPSSIERRFTETMHIIEHGVSIENSLAIYQRFYEQQVVFDTLNENILLIPFGSGFGATLNMTNSEDDSVMNSQLLGAAKTHNIHFLHASILYRYGVVGMAIYLMFLCCAVYNLIKYKRNKNHPLFVYFNLYVVAVIAFSVPASSYLFVDPMLPISLAASDYFKDRS
ncbi:MAG: O-antigen ligase family protein [Colwellia sp.]|jgi:O-Antigen ligase.